MAKIYQASQLIYTSWPNGNSPKKGYMVYSKSKDITPEEEAEIVSTFRYVAPQGLPFAPTKEQVKELFPVMYGYVKLSSGKYVIAKSTYIGQDYTKRYGNYIIHALVFDKEAESLVLPLYGSNLFRSSLTNEELSAWKAPDFLPTLSLNDEMNPLRPYKGDKDFLASLLDIVKMTFQSGKKLNLYLEKEEIPQTIKYLYYLLPDSLKDKFFFTTYSSGDAKLLSVLVRLKTSSTQPAMNPMFVSLSKDNYKNILKNPENTSLLFVEMLSKDPSALPSLTKELNSYVENRLVKDLDEAVILRKTKNGDFSKMTSFDILTKYLPLVNKISSPMLLEKLFSYALTSFSSRKKDIYELFYPLLSSARKEEIFRDYLNLGRPKDLEVFLDKVFNSPVRDKAILLLDTFFESNPSLLDEEDYAPIFESMYPLLAKERQNVILSKVFDLEFEKQSQVFEKHYLPLLKDRLVSDSSFAGRFYSEKKGSLKTREGNVSFFRLFYDLVSKSEQSSMWSVYFNAMLKKDGDISLDVLLQSGFGRKEDGLALLEYNLPSLRKTYQQKKPGLLLELEMSSYQKGNTSVYPWIEESYLEKLSKGDGMAFLNKIAQVSSQLKKELYMSSLEKVKRLNMSVEQRYRYLSLMLNDPVLKDDDIFFEHFYLMEDSLPSSIKDFDRFLKEDVSRNPGLLERLKNTRTGRNDRRALSFFHDMDMLSFKRQDFDSLGSLLNTYHRKVMNDISLSDEDKKIAMDILLDKAREILFKKGNPSFEIAFQSYFEIKKYLLNDDDKERRLLKMLAISFGNISMKDLERDYRRNPNFKVLLSDMKRYSIKDMKIQLVFEGGLFLDYRNPSSASQLSEMEKHGLFTFLKGNLLASYMDDFCSLYLPSILRYFSMSLVRDPTKQNQVIDIRYLETMISTYILPFKDYRKMEKVFPECIKEERGDILRGHILSTLFIDDISQSIKPYNDFLKKLVDSFYKSLDKKQREECFDNMRKDPRKAVKDYPDTYEKSHRGLFGWFHR